MENYSLEANWNTTTEDDIDNFIEDDVPPTVEEGNNVCPSTTTTTTAASNKRKKTLTSKWWQFYDLLEPSEGAEDDRRWSRCKKCGIQYEYKSVNGTNTMKKHFGVCQKVGQHESGQSHIVGPSIQLSHLARPAFDSAIFRDLLAQCVIKHDLPFQFTEWEGVRACFRYLRGQDLTVCSRNTCRADILKMYKREKSKVVAMLQRAPGKISFTSDCWTSITTEGYITLTAHFIDREWNMQKRILNFSYMPPPHNGVCLSQKIMSCLIAWGVDKRVMTITLDNATANDSCIDLLIENLRNRGVMFFNEDYVHIRCCAHIINLHVQDGLKEKVVDPAVKKVRESVKYVKGSQARKKKFLECVADCSIDGRKSLKQDVPTRWNSTYIMLESAIYYRRALATLALVDTNFTSCPSSIEWDIVEKESKFLGVFYDMTVLFSGTKYPTANLYFTGVFSAYMTLTEAMDSNDEFMRNMAAPMYAKFEKYWGDFSEILAFVVILDPRYKFSFVEWCFKKVYGEHVGPSKANSLKEKLILLFTEYATAATQHANSSQGASTSSLINPPSSSTSVSLRSQSSVEAMDILSKHTTTRLMEFDAIDLGNMPQKSELEQYLDDQRIDRRTQLDILDFWKSSQFRYPGVAAMARDILAIPISTVASESAFSIGGRVLDQYRSALLPEIVEALLCIRDWLYGSEEMKNEFDDLCRNVIELEVEDGNIGELRVLCGLLFAEFLEEKNYSCMPYPYVVNL